MRRQIEVRVARVFFAIARPFARIGNYHATAQQHRNDAEDARAWAEIKAAPWTWDNFYGPACEIGPPPEGALVRSFDDIEDERRLLYEARKLWPTIRPDKESS